MQRSSFCSLAVLAFFAAGLALAEDTKVKNDKSTSLNKATIATIDSKKDTITLTVKAKDEKAVEKTFQLAPGAEYLDGDGKAAKIGAFQTGDHVLFSEKDGKINELKKCNHHAQAKITNVDAKKGTVTVMTKDKKGKDVERTFKLMEDAEYFDSTGKVARLDVFQSGDEVLIVESEGNLAELKKAPKAKQDDKKPSQK